MALPVDLMVPVAGERIHARHHRADTEDLAAPAGRPCVVMAHGLAATQDSGLEGFVAAFNGAGLDVLTFDYRHFAASSGSPRQLVFPARQVEDYRAVIAAARESEGIDPDRVAAWGVSLSGGHVFHVAAQDPRLAAMVALTPAVDGLAVGVEMIRTQGVTCLAAMAVATLRDVLVGRRGRTVTVPVVGPPGSVAALNSPGAEAGMRRIAGRGWRNELGARLFLNIARYRPVRVARNIRCPALVQIADLDKSVPPQPACVAAERARASVHHYPCDHFDVYTGEEWHQKVRDDQVAFVRRVLAPDEAPAAAGVIGGAR